eukprot:6072206-Pyramimonas_sp.AAC.1
MATGEGKAKLGEKREQSRGTMGGGHGEKGTLSCGRNPCIIQGSGQRGERGIDMGNTRGARQEAGKVRPRAGCTN